MGYGAGAEIKLNGDGGYLEYMGGKTLRLVDVEVESWDFFDAMSGMEKVKASLLKIKYPRIELNDEDREWMKRNGFKKGDRIWFRWIDNPNGYVWSGYTRSALDVAFPVELKSSIECESGVGMFYPVITVEPASYRKFETFVSDVLDFCADDESKVPYLEQHERQDRKNRLRYGANK